MLIAPVADEARRLRRCAEADGRTLRTHNRAIAVHYEHTVVISRGRPLVLTAP